MSASFLVQRYSPGSQIIHWLSALFICLTWALGLFGDEFPKGPLRETANFIHISTGEIIAFLLILRIILRFSTPQPATEPNKQAPWLKLAGRLMHLVLYLLLGAVIIAGVMTQFSSGKALPVFGLYEITSPLGKDRDLRHFIKELHEFFANSLMALALLHASFTFVHHYLLRDNTLKRMLQIFLFKN
ncbi:MAG: cytochrome b [Methylocystis sp.]